MQRRPTYRSNRRGVGNSGGFLPTQLPGCVLWLRADLGVTKDGSDRVSAWADQSGTGDSNKHMAQALGARQPLWNASDANFGGRPTLTFAESRGDRLVSGTWATSAGSPSTWVIAHRPRTLDSSGNSVLMDGDNGAGAGGSRNAIQLETTSSTYDLLSSTVFLSGGAMALNRTDVVACVFGTSARLHRSARTPTTGNSGTNTLERLFLASDYVDSAGWYYDGEIAEVVCYNRALSQAEAEQAMVAFGARYGVTIGA